MKTGLLFLLWWSFLAATNDCLSQDSTAHRDVYPRGIIPQVNFGYIAVRDEHISEEKYAGPVSRFAVYWAWFHETYGFRIGIAYDEASHIKNYNVSAELKAGTFSFVNLYPLGVWSLFGNDAFAFLGPEAEAFVYYRKQNIAHNNNASPNVYQSAAWLFSLGIRLEMVLPFKGGFQLEGAFHAGLISVGGGTGSDAGTGSPITIQTPAGAVRGGIEAGLRYSLIASVSIAVGYRWEVTRISEWNRLLASSDNVCASLAYSF